MPWFKIDDGFHGHPKVLNLTPADVGIWTLAGTWCAQYLTDGQIGMPAIMRLGGTAGNCDALVNAGLWLLNDDGTFQFKDWEDYQPMKVDVESEREASRERMRKVRAKRKGTAGERSDDVRPNTPRTFGDGSEEVRLTPTQPDPTRPDPVSKDTEREASQAPPTRKRATRIPEGWIPDDALAQAMNVECPHVDQRLEHRKFVDYWTAQPDSKARKADWDATWRNWIRRAAEKAPTTGNRATDRMMAGYNAMASYQGPTEDPWARKELTP